jgi:hypothetical protein
MRYLERYGLKMLGGFLEDFCQHWPADADHTDVGPIRAQGPARTGSATDCRLTEQWTSSAKSVFLFEAPGSVANSTPAGLPWLRRIKMAAGQQVHSWPFDGRKVPGGRSVIVEVYPSLVRNRYPKVSRTKDQQQAHAVARWLAERDGHGFLARYFDPPLTAEQRRVADLEGWLFGVSYAASHTEYS